MRLARITPTWTTVDRLHQADLEQAAVVEAIFLWNTSQRDAMMPRKPFPHPELDQKLNGPAQGNLSERNGVDVGEVPNSGEDFGLRRCCL